MKSKDNDKGSFKKADAFLNMKIIGKPGENGKPAKEHNLPKGIPLYLDRRWDKALIASGDEKLAEMMKAGQIVLSINVADTSEEEIEL